jgi:hypothetical protein
MSKPTKQDELTAILIIQNAVDHYLSQPEYLELSEAVQAKIERFLAPLAKRKQSLLSPAPKKPKPRAPKPKAAPAAEHAATGSALTVVPVPSGLQHTSDVRKRSRQ